MLDKEEKIQYSRHILLNEIGLEGQEKLKSAKVLVIGAGGLGCPILQYLTAAGVGTIGIIDNDVVDQTNLQRQVLYTVDDIGKSKAKVASEKLSKLNPFVFFKVYEEKLDNDNALELFSEYDIIVDGSDNFPTRYLVNDACVITDKPLVFGSIFKFQGQVSVLNYENGPTYRCLFPNPPEEGAVPNCSDIGVLGILPGIIGNLQANETIKIIVGIGEVLKGKLLYFDALTLQQQILSFNKNENIYIDQLVDDYDFFCGIKSNTFKEISATELKKNLENYQILDVRSQKEFEHYNIGGIHIPLDTISTKTSELNNKKSIVVCCQSGLRSKKAIEIIREYRDDLHLINLKDGLSTY
ncbi:molybdopterin-synthase adenylyltransferase MoeB [Aquimarina sp. MMG015]|uniref:molybdopterin-synthase adenylyltransferase MoeB n=1 Tax=Aquimarina TaxID=290174 RepID=UPI00041A13CE|nr:MULTISPECIES: molybdopterin-synthase adenylyltransferase MoeB [Aquimarina]AXT56979.1 molybdopterin-synthase adenylyltransferase MoeB [Aquimarina sp. AD1]MBQ4801776.1 molybdopterin-synthase adenylyltransferase MoeB [Aquimarina sp. MMG015]RKN36949.1 molybdopterin-synthase adenylyltransferase MoeB [Aquimarina sp. AD1]